MNQEPTDGNNDGALSEARKIIIAVFLCYHEMFSMIHAAGSLFVIFKLFVWDAFFLLGPEQLPHWWEYFWSLSIFCLFLPCAKFQTLDEYISNLKMYVVLVFFTAVVPLMYGVILISTSHLVYLLEATMDDIVTVKFWIEAPIIDIMFVVSLIELFNHTCSISCTVHVIKALLDTSLF